MFEFDYTWLFILLPLPLVVWWLVAPYKEQRSALWTPFFEDMVRVTGKKPARGAVILRLNLIQKVLFPLYWILLVATLARPQWVGEPIIKTESARDLMLAVDLSGSMETVDFRNPAGEQINRLQAVKIVLDDFILRRESDRLGLIFFGTGAFLQVPFTQDHDTCRFLLEEAQVRMAGPQTMIGDAIGLAITLFEQSKTKNKVLIMLTDGSDTGSKVPPVKAADIAKENGIKIYTIAVGDPQAVGEQKLDEETLEEIAQTTGGQFYRAYDQQELDTIYQEMDRLEPQTFDTLSYRPRRELFHWPLGTVIVLLFLYHLTIAVSRSSARKMRANV